jgi:FKBP-type peptidyl-prolyl cis-trans isomerase SlyD
MEVGKNKVVTVAYSLKVDGQVWEESTEKEPLVYIAGIGMMIPGFEKQLNGLKTGQSYSISVSPEEGYGDYNPKAVATLPMSTFEVDGKIQEDLLFVGNLIPLQDDEGNPLSGEVTEIKDETVTVDFNHKLSGKVLHFDGQIKDVREATIEELDHGHVHGPGGVEH